ncbi:MAG: ATP-binding cassette domain-containing protein [Oscillospiraceae bacterium]
MQENILTVNHLYKWYEQRNDKLMSLKKINVQAVDDVSFTLNKRETLGIIGESGCGKSTLGKVLLGLESPTKGEIIIDGKDAINFLKTDRLNFRKTVQIVFQNPFDTFNPRHKIGKILERIMKLHNIEDSNEARKERAIKELENVGLLPGKDFYERFPHELSGGQLQRVSILRSMILQPKIIVADEPVSMLDVSVRADIINMFAEMIKQHDTSIIFISHDIATTRYISDKIAVMYLGRIVETGKTEDIIQNPMHPYTKALISNCASIDVDEERKAIKINGEPPTPINPGPGCYFAKRCPMATEKCFKTYPEYTKFGDDRLVSCHLCTKENVK